MKNRNNANLNKKLEAEMKSKTSGLKPLIKIINLVVILHISTSCSQEQPATWEDIKNLNLRVTMDGVNFNEPLHYHAVFARDPKDWPEISSKIREGKERSVVNNVIVYALLPNLEPVTEKNKQDFTALGWGRKLDAYLTHPRSFEFFFKNYLEQGGLERLPNLPEVSGMLHYKDKDNQDDIFLSHDHAVPELTLIRCKHAEEAYQSPYCKVETQYRYETSNNKNGDKKITPFYLNYSFARSYLPQWREIDRKLKALYDQFAQSAEKQP